MLYISLIISACYSFNLSNDEVDLCILSDRSQDLRKNVTLVDLDWLEYVHYQIVCVDEMFNKAYIEPYTKANHKSGK